MGNNNITLKSGEILFIQGDTPNEFFMLQSGKVEILSAPDEYNGLDKEIILSKSKRVSLIEGKGIIVGMSNLFIEPNVKSVRAVEDSTLTKYPLPKDGFKAISQKDPSQAATILRQLFNRLNNSISNDEKFTKLSTRICILSDNLSLLHKELSLSSAGDILDSNSEELYNTFISSGGKLPEKITGKYLITDNSDLLKKDYGPKKIKENDFRADIFNITKRFLQLKPQIFALIIKEDPLIAIDIFDLLSRKYIKSLERIEVIHAHIENTLAKIFGHDESWSNYIVSGNGYNDWLNTGKVNIEFLKDLLTIAKKINPQYDELSGRKITEDFPGIKDIHVFYQEKSKSQSAPEEKNKPEQKDTGSSTNKLVDANLKNSINQIFEFAFFEKESQTKLLTIINNFKKMKNPLATDSDGRKLRRQITKLYWDLYKQVYIRSKADSSMPIAARLMLNYGFLDEELVEREQANDLLELIKVRENPGNYQILHEHEFLDRIYSGEEEPSMTEMGLNYKAHVREQEKHMTKKQRANMDQGGSEIHKKTLFEIEQRLRSTAGVCSGSTSTAFPILNYYTINGGLKNIYTQKSKVETILSELNDIDFSLFYRETVLKLGEAREIIKEEIKPYFILLPIYGTRTLLWQELSGTNKRSMGRIVIPLFFLGDLKKELAHTLACFRWELNRTIKGQAMWADPIDGGITGEYFDYVNTYKKNANLSTEAKIKIKERFKGLRTNRDRFAEEYSSWLMYEKNGIMKLNSVVRGMMYKHIPFKKEIRDQLIKMPAFSKYATVYNNISKRNYVGFERRFKKYTDESDNYPPEIEQYMKFLKL